MGEEPAAGAAGHDEQAGPSGRDLGAAIVVGVALVGLLLGSLAWHPAAFTVVVAGLLTVAAVESSRAMSAVGWPVLAPVVIVADLALLAATYGLGHAGQGLGMVVLFVGAAVWEMADRRRSRVVRTLASTVLLGTWLGLLASYAVLLVTRPTGAEVAVLAVIGAAVFADIGGYAAGSMAGRHKVAPSVSPNKTWEGLLGGLALAAVVAALVLPRLGGLFDPAEAVVVAVVSGLAGFVGDLTESLVKRDLGVKDLGRTLPGHGGVLDRVDGILLALPAGYYALELIV